jgi:hypothetical protein
MKSLAVAAVVLACGCSDSDSHEYIAVVRGTLATTDLAQAKVMHDQIAQGGQATAMEHGDFAHHVLLGTTLLDSTHNEFLAIDRWDDRREMERFYASPGPLGTLFASPPTIEYFVAETDWVQWGDMTSGEAYDPYYIHFALGELAQDQVEANRDAHNLVAMGGKDPSIGAGNVAHVVVLGTTDDRRFLGVDIWGSADNIQGFYTNPDFVAVFAPLFSSISQPVYQSTDWYQW